MVDVTPLNGITYNKEKIDHLDDVMSPPYDIISSEMQETLYQKHPYNFVRLILGKKTEQDTEKNNRYTRAQKQFNKWLQESILIGSDEPSIFPYKIDYKINGSSRTMSGFFILLKLDPSYEKVKAHEKTLSKPKADRLNLMRACQANLEPIQLLYIDEQNEIQKKIEENIQDKPYISVKGYDTFIHSIWKLTDDETINYIKKKLKDEILFIADGHHRYQTAVNFAEEMKSKHDSNNSAYNYRMVILANMFDEGLAILPTHRLMHLPHLDRTKFIEQVKKYFMVKKYQIDDNKNYTELSENIKNQIKTDSNHKFALYFKDSYFVLTLKDEKTMNQLATNRSETWRTLDVSILHKIIIENILNITQDSLEDHVKYTREDTEALQFVDEGRFDFSILMNATKIDELKTIAEAGEHMPQKSTYFLPKMLSGLVMYKMNEKSV